MSARRVALVAMPWAELLRPSAAVGALTAFLRREVPRLQVTSYSEYLTVGSALGEPIYGPISHSDLLAPELLYMPQLYPERAAAVAEWFSGWWVGESSEVPAAVAWEALQEVLPRHVEDTARRLVDGGYCAVGMTTCFGQLYANLALASRIKALAPHMHVILGGSLVSDRVGPSIIAEYPYVDFVVQGEGERPLTALIQRLLDNSAPQPIPGVLERHGERQPPRLFEVKHLDELPIPDYDEYAERAEEAGMDWVLPLEGSRGCWWDRANRTGNPRATCYFCNLNVQWSGYREKSVQRVADEMRTLSHRYNKMSIFLLDNILRHRGTEDLARAITRMKREFDIFMEMRANVTPHQMVLLWEAGLRDVQFGIEALSTSYLKRIGKGTTTIQNLQVMKTCYELGINHNGNLVVEFPGATEAEVVEMAEYIRRFGIIYQPLTISGFSLGLNSTVERLPDEFGIRNIRNWDGWRVGLPDDVFHRIRLLYLSADADPGVRWDVVRQARAEWVRRHEQLKEPLLHYRDGRTFLKIMDKRGDPGADGAHKIHIILGLARQVYLTCMEITRYEDLKLQFCRKGVTEEELQCILGEFVEDDLVFVEDGRYLSLAVSPQPTLAAARIRATERARRPASRPTTVVPALAAAAC